MEAVRGELVPGPDGPIPVRVYRPRPDPVGVVVFYHGGGWRLGDLETHDQLCRELVGRSGATVVAVDYRLAPEHPFPAATVDAYASLEWVSLRRESLAGPDAPLAVAGDSAGGT